jgi:8-oxo-dGTP diphosphatase
VTAQEVFFLVRVREQAIETTGHTALEQRIMQSHRWFTREELATWHETIFPEEVLTILQECGAR